MGYGGWSERKLHGMASYSGDISGFKSMWEGGKSGEKRGRRVCCSYTQGHVGDKPLRSVRGEEKGNGAGKEVSCSEK